MSRSHSLQATLLAWVPCIPTMPVVRGCAPGKPPPPMTVMATGQSSFSAKAAELPVRPPADHAAAAHQQRPLGLGDHLHQLVDIPQVRLRAA